MTTRTSIFFAGIFDPWNAAKVLVSAPHVEMKSINLQQALHKISLTNLQPQQEMMSAWEKRLSRGGQFKLASHHTVCELHFEKKFILDTHDLQIDGINLSDKRLKKKLTKDAIPTVFHGYPSYMQKKEPAKRKSPRKREASEPANKRRTTPSSFEDNSILADAPVASAVEENIEYDQPSTLQETIERLTHEVKKPPNWHIHRGQDFLSFVHIQEDNIQIDRFIKFKRNEGELFLCGKKIDFKDFKPTEITEAGDVSSLLKKVQALTVCPGTGINNARDTKCTRFLQRSGAKQKLPPRCCNCAARKKTVAKGIRRAISSKFKQLKKQQQKCKEIKSLREKVHCRNKKITSLKERFAILQEKFENLNKSKFDKYIADMALPPKWQNAMNACYEAAKAKSPNGRRYTNQWIYECSLLRIKSLGLYKKMLRDNFLPLPSLRTLQRYMKKLKPSYGFQENTFKLLKEKSQHMPENERHGSLLLDEVKLSEGIHFDKITLRVKGMVFLGDYTPEAQRDSPADHALVFMFQSFRGQYVQSVGAFLTRGAAKGPELAKLIMEGIGLLEQNGFYVDAVVSDAHASNRNMRAEFGLRKKNHEKEGSTRRYALDDEEETDENFDYELILAYPTAQRKRPQKSKKKQTNRKRKVLPQTEDQGAFQASCEHPFDKNRRLWFVSDFPHLIKSVKQRIINAEQLETPDGKIKLNHWMIVCNEDEKRGIKVAPKLSKAHFQSETYAAMSVKTAFSFFSEQVATAMEHYQKAAVKGMEDCGSTVAFIRRINVVIDAMNSNTRRHGLKAKGVGEDEALEPPICPECQVTHAENSPRHRHSSRKVLEDFLQYLNLWEKDLGVKRDQRLTASAAYGLRISITSALELSHYLITNLNFEYFMTRRVNQDALEHFFGKIRQGCGAHGHPDPVQFIQVYRLSCFGSLVKPPRGSNVSGGEMLNSLLSLPDLENEINKKRRLALEKEFDEALDTGEVISGPFSDHTYYESLTIDPAALKYFGGYVARKAKRFTCAKNCVECFSSLRAPTTQLLREEDDIIHSRSVGYLIIPSDKLMNILEKLETSILEVFQLSHLHEDIIFEVTDKVKEKEFQEIGCESHQRILTKYIINFYLNTRMIFACEEYNRRISENAHKKAKAKQQQKMFRLTC